MQTIRHVAAISVTLGLVLPCFAQEPNGQNCDLATAPSDAGEIFFTVGKVTAIGRVYPRLSEIPVNYTGCQILWASINSGRITRAVTFFRAGRVVSVSPVPDGIPLCATGEKSSDTGCTSRKIVVQVSYPAGCAARTLESKALPRSCAEAFEAEFKLHDQITD